MKKYRVTEKHQILKEGLIIDKKTDSLLVNSEVYFGVFTIKEWLRDGWIEEIQEPEFTKDDIWYYYEFLFKSHKAIIVNKEGFESTFNNWQNEIEKK